jgi:hypothetical protein
VEEGGEGEERCGCVWGGTSQNPGAYSACVSQRGGLHVRGNGTDHHMSLRLFEGCVSCQFVKASYFLQHAATSSRNTFHWCKNRPPS